MPNSSLSLAKRLCVLVPFSALGVLILSSADAAELDKASKEALVKTQRLLTDQMQRQAAIKGDEKASAVDQSVHSLTGGNSKLDAEIYALAAEIFGTVVKSANGDPAKMQEAMEKFQKNPEAFASQFTPEERAKLHEIGEKLGGKTIKP